MSWSRVLSTLVALGCALLAIHYRQHDAAVAGAVIVAHLAGYAEALSKRRRCSTIMATDALLIDGRPSIQFTPDFDPVDFGEQRTPK